MAKKINTVRKVHVHDESFSIDASISSLDDHLIITMGYTGQKSEKLEIPLFYAVKFFPELLKIMDDVMVLYSDDKQVIIK